MDLLDLEPIINRLKAQTQGFREVGAAADLASAGAAIASPSAFVVLLGATPFEVAEGSGPLRQWMTATIGVVIAVTVAGKRGVAGLKAVQLPARQVRNALFAWAHPDAERSFHLAGESLEDFDAKTGQLLYRVDFSTLVLVKEDI